VTLSLIAVYDRDQQTLAAVFGNSSESEAVQNAREYVRTRGQLVGEGPERDLRVVEIKEV
jgi:hypothetical protein